MLVKHKLLKTGINYSFASTLSTVSAMIVGFVNMHILGPELLGIWSSVTIILSYLSFAQLGIQSGLNLNLPVLLGSDEFENAYKQIRTALGFAVILSIVLFIISCIAIVVLVICNVDNIIIYAISSISILAIGNCFQMHYIATYRSANAFDRLTRIYLADCVISILLIGLIYKYFFYGLLLYQVLHAFIKVSLMFYYAPYKHLMPSFNKDSFLALLKPGIVMTVINQILEMVRSMPRLLLLNLGGVVSVGLFNPALTVGSCINLIPGQLAQFLHPQFGHKYGQTKCARDMWPYLMKVTMFAPIVILPFSVVGWFVIPFILEHAFPKYLSSLWPIRIMLIGFLFSSTYLTRGFLLVIKAYKRSVLLVLLDLLLFTSLPLFLIKATSLDILIAVAVGLSISYFVTYWINICVVKNTINLTSFNNPT